MIWQNLLLEIQIVWKTSSIVKLKTLKHWHYHTEMIRTLGRIQVLHITPACSPRPPGVSANFLAHDLNRR